MTEKITFKKLDDYSDQRDGSYLIGTIDVTLVELIQTLGEPSSIGDENKTDACWELEFSDGTFASIYNWKTSRWYDPDHGQNLFHVRCWHVGGHSQRAHDLVTALFAKEEEVDQLDLEVWGDL